VRSIALRGLWGRKLRTFLTAFAIVLGIATVSGTFVLTDSIRHAFDAIFSSIYQGTDASITGKSAVSLSATQNLPPFDESELSNAAWETIVRLIRSFCRIALRVRSLTAASP
jgi:ABC-type antimicrobial peptide transport system permease subunit